MEIKKVLVTGCNGYIGAVLIEKLAKRNFMVTGLDTFYFKDNGISPSFSSDKIHHIHKDVRNITQKDVIGYDAIIHLAALSNDPIGALHPDLTLDINYKATMALAKLAKKAGIPRFIFSSSCSIYGIAETGIVDETSPVNALTVYAQSKALVEKDLQDLADKNFYVGLMRNSTVYGFSSQLRNDLVVNNFVTCAIALGKIEIMSDGTPWRPLIDVRDLCDFFILFINAPKETNGVVYNIGFNDNNFQVRDLLEEIQKQLINCKIVYTGQHGADARSYKVNFNKIHKLFPQKKQEWTLSKSVHDLISQLKRNGFKKDDFTSGKFTRLNTLTSLLDKNLIDQKLFWTK